MFAIHAEDIGGFHPMLLHRATLGAQLHTYCLLIPCRNEKIFINLLEL